MKINKPLIKVLSLHLSLMFVIATGTLFLFFKLGLPLITRHSQSIAVPSLKGRSLTEAAAYLRQHGLHFEISNDLAHDPQCAPESVLRQYPRAGAKVKRGRKVFLTLNTSTPPTVSMPNLVDSSLRNARILLQSQGLLLGKVKYTPDIAQNAVLEQRYQGEVIPEGTAISKGSTVDLVVGTGLGQRTVVIPDVVGMSHEEAELALLSIGARVGSIMYQTVEGQPADSVLRQMPTAAQQARMGTTVDLWLAALPEQEAPAAEVPILPEGE